MKIKNIYDEINSFNVEDLLDELKIGNCLVLENDSRICMPNGGSTSIKKVNEFYEEFSSGANWHDQQAEIRTEQEVKEILQEWIDQVSEDFEKHEFDIEDIKVQSISIYNDDEDF